MTDSVFEELSSAEESAIAETDLPTPHEEEGESVLCKNCGAALVFSPELGKFSCEFCGSTFTAAELDGVPEDPSVAEDAAFCEALSEFRCPSCGAEVVADDHTSAEFCAYCGNPVILSGRLSGQHKPAKIIPFSLSKEQAIAALKAHLGKKRMIPKGFFSDATMDKFTGVYYPFWLTDADTDCAIQATGTHVTVWVSGKRRYTRTDYYQVWRRGDVHFEDITTNALSVADKALLEGVLPYPSDAHIDFDMRYMSGFYAKKNDLMQKDVADEVKQKMRTYSGQLLSQTASGYHTFRIDKQAVLVNKSRWEYTLLPIWILHYKYKKKIYHFAVNGLTGKVFGDLPLSRPKFWGLVGGLFALFTTVFSLIGAFLL